MSYSKRYTLSIVCLSLILFLSVVPRPTFAVTVPEFPSCLNPQVTASQVNNGTNHGVVGKNTPYSGTDSIYQLSNGNVLQCLCTTEGSGIQTNWLKVSDLSQKEIQDLLGQGWTYIDNGALWGLQSDPYLAKNTDYTCHTTTGASQGITAGIALHKGVLGLAATGNTFAIYGLILLGVISFFTGLFFSRAKRTR